MGDHDVTDPAIVDPAIVDPAVVGRPASELGDEELEAQGTQAHATRNWVFLHGSAEQFSRHTRRMLELEEEYVRRFPRRTWQGSGGAPEAEPTAHREPEVDFLRALDAAGGHLHKLEAHQVARECGLERAALARLYKSDPPQLRTEGEERVLTDAGRARL